jgi:hypothetical protein
VNGSATSPVMSLTRGSSKPRRDDVEQYEDVVLRAVGADQRSALQDFSRKTAPRKPAPPVMTTRIAPPW